MADSDHVVDCRNCGEPMPVDASRCPHCEERVSTKPWAIGLTMFGLLVGGVFLVGGLTDVFLLRNWQAGVAAGLFIALMGGRLYRIRRQKLDEARPRET